MNFTETELKTSALAVQQHLLTLQAIAYANKANEFNQRATKCREQVAELCEKQSALWKDALSYDAPTT